MVRSMGLLWNCYTVFYYVEILTIKDYFITQNLLILGSTGQPVMMLFFLVSGMSDNRTFKEFLNYLEYVLRLVNYISLTYLVFSPAGNIWSGISSFLRTLPCSERLMNGIHHVFIKLQRCLLLES